MCIAHGCKFSPFLTEMQERKKFFSVAPKKNDKNGNYMAKSGMDFINKEGYFIFINNYEKRRNELCEDRMIKYGRYGWRWCLR